MRICRKERKKYASASVSKTQRTLRRKSALFLAPSLLGVLIFFVLPFLGVIYYACSTGAGSASFVGLDNFGKLLNNRSFLLAAKNSGLLCGVAVPLAVLSSLGLALLLDRKLPGYSTIRTAILSPMMVPVASVVLVWRVLFHQNGTVNAFLTIFGLDPVDFFHSNWSYLVVLLLYLWRNLGYFMLLFIAGLAAVPRDLVDMANLEGAGPARRFFAVKLPYLSSSILFVAIMGLISAMKIFREVYLLTGSYPYESLYLLQHFMDNMFRSMDYQKLSAAALLLVLAMSVIIGLLLLVSNRLGRDTENET